jgi:S-methylmethionine-dependent homocysteine/selenocysteine methylase
MQTTIFDSHIFLTAGGTEAFLQFLQRYPLRSLCSFELLDDDRVATLDRGDSLDLAERVAELLRTYGLRVVGGCRGTDAEHLAAIARALHH